MVRLARGRSNIKCGQRRRQAASSLAARARQDGAGDSGVALTASRVDGNIGAVRQVQFQLKRVAVVEDLPGRFVLQAAAQALAEDEFVGVAGNQGIRLRIPPVPGLPVSKGQCSGAAGCHLLRSAARRQPRASRPIPISAAGAGTGTSLRRTVTSMDSVLSP